MLIYNLRLQFAGLGLSRFLLSLRTQPCFFYARTITRCSFTSETGATYIILSAVEGKESRFEFYISVIWICFVFRVLIFEFLRNTLHEMRNYLTAITFFILYTDSDEAETPKPIDNECDVGRDDSESAAQAYR